MSTSINFDNNYTESLSKNTEEKGSTETKDDEKQENSSSNKIKQERKCTKFLKAVSIG
jgi:hypothetical protein